MLLTMDTALYADIEELGRELVARGWMCAVAESCTGGLLGACCTSVPGASQWFAGGVISYANAVKVRLLEVENAALAAQGAVSEQVVLQMAAGACRTLNVQAAVSISGVAGPSGGTKEKPVGTVWLGFCVQGRCTALRLNPADTGRTREDIRAAAVRAAVRGLKRLCATY